MPRRHSRVAAGAAVLLSVLVGCLSVVVAPRAAGADEPVVHQPPVDAPVVDPFRPPRTRFGPGNRGLTYDLPAGTAVHASAPGTVVFAGPVAGTLHVTILHADGLRTSYSFLESVGVRRGQTVERGDRVGTAGAGFHFGLRSGDRYLDPASLFGETVVHVRLVPHAEPLPPTDAGLLREQAWVRELAWAEQFSGGTSTWDRIRAYGGAALDGVRRLGEGALGYVLEIPPIAVTVDTVRVLWDHYRTACTPGDTEVDVPAAGRTAVLVAGLGSSSDGGAIDDLDLDALGYDPAHVLRYSYRGGRTPTVPGSLDPALEAIAASTYTAEDTNDDIVARGRALADLIQATAQARPGVRVDVYAHSLGGVVTRVALLELARRSRGLDALGEVVTIGSPHDGADLASIAAVSGRTLHGTADVVRGALGIDIDPDGTSVLQLAEGSDLIDHLHDQGIPDGVDFRTVAARGDLVVPATRASVDGYPAAVVDLVGVHAHGDLPGSPAVTRELQLGLAHLPPACEGLVDALLDAVVPGAVTRATDALTVAAFFAELAV